MGEIMEKWTRRSFCLSGLAGGLAWSAGRLLAAAKRASGLAPAFASTAENQSAAARPVIISASYGYKWLDQGMAILKKGGDTLDAVLAVVTPVEDDPNINTVGLGGLPNEGGVVQLDACVMHGPTRLAGAVGAIEDVKNPSRVARAVMERTDHIFLVGRGATRFALDEGFEKVNLLTEKSRLAWLAWKASTESNWNPPLGSPAWRARLAALLDTSEKMAWAGWIEDVVAHPPTGTITCMAVDERGDVSGCTTTSGLAWKISGRVGDSPIIGAGLYVDNDVGAAGSTGRGEENIRVVGGHTVVEMMRRGKNPTDACLEALDRVVRNFAFDKSRLRRFYLLFYAVNKDGAHGAAALWAKTRTGEPFTYAVHDGREARLPPCAALFEGQTEM
jgi:N4-(beta-N-acetylglucosaminyl)-L-asparaginase